MHVRSCVEQRLLRADRARMGQARHFRYLLKQNDTCYNRENKSGTELAHSQVGASLREERQAPVDEPVEDT